tara:strand:- start:57 stop:386 length:330 start_codon:yes stop_codon:yes gene_type:complete
MRYGWYSRKQHGVYNRGLNGKKWEVHIYLDECGRRCVCTTITSIDRKPESEVYDDYVLMGKMRCWIGNMSMEEGKSIEYMRGLGIDRVTDDILRRERELKEKIVYTKER